MHPWIPLLVAVWFVRSLGWSGLPRPDTYIGGGRHQQHSMAGDSSWKALGNLGWTIRTTTSGLHRLEHAANSLERISKTLAVKQAGASPLPILTARFQTKGMSLFLTVYRELTILEVFSNTTLWRKRSVPFVNSTAESSAAIL